MIFLRQIEAKVAVHTETSESEYEASLILRQLSAPLDAVVC